MKISNEIKIGFISILTIAFCIWGFNFLKGKNILKNTKTYYAVYEKVGGLLESGSILINGYKVGMVEDIYFLPDQSGNLLVRIEIGKKYKIPKKSIAQIYSSDIMGTKAIELLLSDSLSHHNEGDTLLSNLERNLAEQVSMQMLPLKHKAEDLMKDMQEAVEIVKYIFNESTRDNLSKSFLSIKNTITNLEKTSFTIDTLLLHEKGKLTNFFSNIESISSNLRENNENLTHIIDNFSAISDSIAKSEITSTIYNANLTLSQANEIVNKINKGEGSIGLLLNNDTLYYNMVDASMNLGKLLKDIRLNPKKYIHFSVFDIGRTVSIAEEKDKKNKKKNKSNE